MTEDQRRLAKQEERRISAVERHARTVELTIDIMAIHAAVALGKWLAGLITPLTDADRNALKKAQERRNKRKQKR